MFEPKASGNKHDRTAYVAPRRLSLRDIALGVSGAGAAGAHAPLKVAGIARIACRECLDIGALHKALRTPPGQGVIEYVFSEGVSGTAYPAPCANYAEQGNNLIIGEAYAVEKEARQVAADYPDTAFVLGSSGRRKAAILACSAPGICDGAYLAAGWPGVR